MASEEGEPVLLHVYDLSQGLARQLSGALLGQMLEGIWHTGVVVYGREYFFGGGIQTGRPGRTQYGNPVKTVPLGRTEVPLELVEDFLNEIKDRYSVYTYNLMRHNCNHFSNELSTFLTGTGIPSDILELPQRVLSSPFGAMLAPLIEQMETGMRGNQVPSQALFNAPPLDFAAVRPPQPSPQANPYANPQPNPLQNSSNPLLNPAQTPVRPGLSSVGAPSAARTPSLSRPPANLSPVGTPVTPHLANLSQNLQTPVAPAKAVPSPATAQELRASRDVPASTNGAPAGASLTGPRAAAAAAAEARAKLAAAGNSNGRAVAGPVANGGVGGSTGSGKSLNVSREVVQKEVKAEFAEVMKEGKLTPNQAAAIALARVMERHSLESPTKKGARLATEAAGPDNGMH
ncbi:hypothetical protein KFL_001050090 [Klebsormidium nitens]|uniref:PPPDE domain-containing protein n=1 Tax=Klebsormidium nitens TaxID=105231 RepID=A0A1Y1HUD5_KLENI|nr:hypothetical protein KFL_001050090 [Klebsormidium nitens]|eukprot:GAQ82245.1 hypothetical protein KFL_001050090 [Klebsormidium nitens]